MLAVASPVPLPSPSPKFSRPQKEADGQPQQPQPPPHPRSGGGGAGLEAILKDTVEFVEGSSTGALVQAESKYPYINDDPQTPEAALPPRSPTARLAPPSASSPAEPARPAATQPQQQSSLYDRPIVVSWITSREPRSGLINTGNTCFLNSVIQCLVHTPPLQHILQQHSSPLDKCRAPGVFCMTCSLRSVMMNYFERSHPFVPTPVVKNLRNIAKHMHHGHQEDAHEFLRYTVDALQRACLASYSSELESKLAGTTWVHKLFGGRLRSRVTCTSCSHPSDTFDAILDLSLDIHNASSVRQALAKFVQVDFLRGANKYKCERCKRAVNAEKQFTVHDAPLCLTVHFKRFTPLGRKMGHIVDYGHILDLQPAMSEGQRGSRYVLYGVISHAGSGPNSGHYYAHVKGPDGSWYEANDESVIRCSASSVVGRKNAYMLFYIRQQDDVLSEAIGFRGLGLPRGGMRRRPIIDSDEEEEDRGVPAEGAAGSPSPSATKPSGATFIGPRLPSPAAAAAVYTRPDPQAVALQSKIAKVKAAVVETKPSLVPYSSDAEEEEEEEEEGEGEEKEKDGSRGDELVTPRNSSPAAATRVTSPPSSATMGLRTSSPVHPTSFYGDYTAKKRRSPDGMDDMAGGDAKRARASPPEEKTRRPPLKRLSFGTPFTASNMSDNLYASRDKPSHGGSSSSSSEFNPANRSSPKQRIAGVGAIGSFRPAKRGYASAMKRRIIM